MPTVPLLTDAEIATNPTPQTILDDIRTTRNSPSSTTSRRALANHPDNLAPTQLVPNFPAKQWPTQSTNSLQWK